MRARVPWRNTDRTGTILLLTGGATGWVFVIAAAGAYGILAVMVAGLLLGAAIAEFVDAG